MSSSTPLAASFQVPSIKVSTSDSGMDSKTYDNIMAGKPPAPDKKFKDLTSMERGQIRYALAPPPDARYLKKVSLKIKCGEYEWNVHGELVTPMSSSIKDKVDVNSQDNVVDLSEFKPDLVARMIQYCYWERYPISPDFDIVPGSKTVSQVMSESLTTGASSSAIPSEPKFDSVLHMEMYVLGMKLEMKYLVEYAQKKFKKSVQVEREGFWECVEMINTIDEEEIADKAERRLRHAIEGRVWSTRRPFQDLEKLRPMMAARISDAGKRRFNMP